MDPKLIPPGVCLTPLKIMPLESGDVWHGMKNTDSGYAGFGEAYFSNVRQGYVKAWKRHRNMTLNLVVPVGAIKFVIYDDRLDSLPQKHFYEVTLSLKNYQRLTVPPRVWMGFQGVGAGDTNLLLNIANILHDPDEVDRCDEQAIKYSW
ncbi:dTDP-4-dehydrorhamnose 3,5-epimerase [Deltaproteobacteria bacterium TL4]